MFMQIVVKELTLLNYKFRTLHLYKFISHQWTLLSPKNFLETRYNNVVDMKKEGEVQRRLDTVVFHLKYKELDFYE